jgi:hypothetical protein
VQNNSDDAVSVAQKSDASSTAARGGGPQGTSEPAPTSTQVPSIPFWNITAKDVLHDTVSLASDCAWPTVILIIVVLMRKKIMSLPDRLIKWRGFGVDAEFQEGLQQIERIRVRDDSYQETEMITVDGSVRIIDQGAPVEQLTHDNVKPEALSEDPKANEVKQKDIETTVCVVDATSPAKDKENSTERIQRLVQVSPAAAVTEAYSYLERQAQLTGTSLGIAPPTLRNVVKYLVDKGRLPNSTTEMANRLQSLRNRAAHTPAEGIQANDALEYWTLSRDLMEQLAAFRKTGEYTIVYKGGPNDGIIETGEDARRTIWGLGAQMKKGKLVLGPPQVGRGSKGMSHALLFAMIYQRLSWERCFEIYAAAGFDVNEVWMNSTVHYHCDTIIDDIVVMKFYPKGEPCPCEPPDTSNEDGEADKIQEET